MARKKQEINPKCRIRLKQLCDDLNISQKQLASASGVSENTLSKIATGKSPLTQATAAEIIKIVPSYRIEWLMGLDDQPHEVHVLHVPGLEEVVRSSAAMRMLECLGISVGQSNGNGVFFPASRGFLLRVNEAEIRKGNTTIWSGPRHEVESALLEICEFAEFKIGRLCNKAEE